MMDTAILTLMSSLVQMSGWELLAVLLALAYLVLAARENILCWYCALISTAIYVTLFWDVSLFMESALNIYYMVMAIYGWYQWRYGGSLHHGIAIRRLAVNRHLAIIAGILFVSGISGYLLTGFTTAAWPYVDSFTTWSSVVTTYMVARKILENWLYWFVIDSISIPLYIDRGLYLTALLFVIYLVIVFFGYMSWRRHYLNGYIATACA
jgi:nicotinamide mononucleotide transporter